MQEPKEPDACRRKARSSLPNKRTLMCAEADPPTKTRRAFSGASIWQSSNSHCAERTAAAAARIRLAFRVRQSVSFPSPCPRRRERVCVCMCVHTRQLPAECVGVGVEGVAEGIVYSGESDDSAAAISGRSRTVHGTRSPCDEMLLARRAPPCPSQPLLEPGPRPGPRPAPGP